MRNGEVGQTAIEYALVVAGISLVLAVLIIGMFTDVLLDATSVVDGIL